MTAAVHALLVPALLAGLAAAAIVWAAIAPPDQITVHARHMRALARASRRSRR